MTYFKKNYNLSKKNYNLSKISLNSLNPKPKHINKPSTSKNVTSSDFRIKSKRKSER